MSEIQNSIGSPRDSAVVDPKCKLYQDLIENDEPVKVYLRIRGRTEDEKKNRTRLMCHNIETEDGTMKVHISGNTKFTLASQTFSFSKIYDQEADQAAIFNCAIADVIGDYINGNNCLVFNYGVTNSGKTFTMQGTPAQPGIIPRSLDVIFQSIGKKLCSVIRLKPHNGSILRIGAKEAVQEQEFKENIIKMDADIAGNTFMETFRYSKSCSEDSVNVTASELPVTSISEMSSTKSSYNFSRDSLGDLRYSVWVSFIEVYNEHIFDLLVNVKAKKRMPLKLCERHGGQIFIKGVNEVCVSSAEEAYKILLFGQKNLHYAMTKLNHNSSRSHCIFSLKLLSTTVGNAFHDPMITQLAFCDLAGSERSSKSKCVGDRLREAGIINTSLMVLGRCIETLRNNQGNSKEKLMVPFRESKLTRLLQKYFTEKGKVIMIVNVSPCEDVVDETLHVLKFSAIAKEVLLSNSIDLLSKGRPTKLSLDFLRQSLMGRESVQWEYSVENGSRSTYSKEVLDEDEDEEKIQQLVDIIQLLQERLLEEKREKLNMESTIRQELCSHFAAQMREMEEYYRDRIAEELEEADEASEQRLRILTEYVQSNKRERTEEDDAIPIVVTCATTDKDLQIAELQCEIKLLEANIEGLKGNLKDVLESEAKAHELNTRLQFQMSEVMHKSFRDKSVGSPSREVLGVEDICKNISHVSAEQQLQKLQDELDTATAQLLIERNNVTELQSNIHLLEDKYRSVNVLEPNDHSMVTKELESVKHDLQQLKAQNSALESENARLQSLLVSSSKMDVLNKSALNGLSKHLKLMERCINTLKTSNDDHAQKMMESQNLHQTIYFSASTSVSSGSRSCSDEVFQEKCSPKMCSDNRKSVRFSREQQDEQNELIMDQSSKNIEASEGHLAHQTMSDTSAMENMILHIAVDSEQQQGCTDNKNSLNHEVSEGDESDDQEIEDVIVIQEANFHSSAPSSNLKATLDNKSLLLQLEKTENELKERMTENSDLKAKYRDLMVVVEELEAQHNNKVENVISSNSLDNDGNSSVLDENRNLLLKLEKMESELKESNAENMDLKEKYCELMKMEENFSFLEKERDTLLKENILLKEKVQLLTEQSYNGDDGDSNYECKYDIVLPSRRSRMKREVKSYYEDSENDTSLKTIKKSKKRTAVLKPRLNENLNEEGSHEDVRSSEKSKQKVNLAKKSQGCLFVSPNRESPSEPQDIHTHVMRKLRQRRKQL